MMDERRNPSYVGSWVDEVGETWRRKGKRGRVLDGRRVRSLLRRDDVPLVVWWSFETTRYDDAAAKLAAAEDLRSSADRQDEDIVASEWQAEDGRLLLMLERRC
jgi:hypothetical protein